MCLLNTVMIWKFGAKQFIPLVREIVVGREEKRRQNKNIAWSQVTSEAHEYIT